MSEKGNMRIRRTLTVSIDGDEALVDRLMRNLVTVVVVDRLEPEAMIKYEHGMDYIDDDGNVMTGEIMRMIRSGRA